MFTRIILILSILIFVFGCGSFHEDIQKVSDNITKSSKALAEGMDKIDPLALKKIMSENENLRNSISQLQASINRVSTGDPFTVLSKQQVHFEILNYEGDFIVNLYVDEPAKFGWVNQQFPDNKNDYKLNIDYWGLLDQNFKWGKFTDNGVGPGDHYKPYVNTLPNGAVFIDGALGATQVTITEPLFSSVAYPRVLHNLYFRDFGVKIVELMKGTVDQKMAEFLKNHNSYQTQMIADLNQKFFTLGTHLITLQVIPLKANVNGKLNLTARWFTTMDNGTTEEMGRFTFLDSKTGGNYDYPLEINKPVQINFPVDVH